MPKSSKKKKEKAADFSKAKLKLGKGKQSALNATDTSFKARSIAVPVQNIAVERDADVPVTRRNQTLEDILIRLKHYSAVTRRDALAGLREILRLSDQRVDSVLALVLESCGRLIGDEDASVRKALRAFFEWFLPSVNVSKLAPHAPLLLLQTVSSLSHIFPEVRVDAVRILEMTIHILPAAVKACTVNDGSASRVLDSFCSILNVKREGGTSSLPGSTMGFTLSVTSKLDVLRCVRAFLICVYPEDAKSPTYFPTWCFRNAFESEQAFDAFVYAFSKASVDETVWASSESGIDGAEDWPATLDSATNIIDQPADLDEARFTFDFKPLARIIHTNSRIEILALARDFQPLLVDTFLDAAATVLSPEQSPTQKQDVNLMLVSLQLTKIFCASLLPGGKEVNALAAITLSCVRDAIIRLGQLFPFAQQANFADLHLANGLRQMNEIYCELSALMSFADRTDTGHTLSGPSSTGPVFDYILGWLASQDAAVCSEDTYAALVPAMWSLLNHSSSNPDAAARLMSALAHHAFDAPLSSSVKRIAVEHIARLILLQGNKQYRGSFYIESGSTEVREWIATIPKLLWLAGSKHLALTETVLFFLLRSLQQNNQHIVLVRLQVWDLRENLTPMEHSAVLGTQFAPFFHITHHERGPLQGPYSQLPPHLQKLARCFASVCPDSAELQYAIKQC